MIRKNYSTGVVILGAKMPENGAPIALKKKFADEFINTTCNCLDGLKKTHTGSAIINAIDASGHTVSIVRVAKPDDGNYQSGGGDGEMVIPIEEVHDDGTTELSRVLDIACEDLSGRSKLKKFLRIGKARPRFLNREAIARLVGLTAKSLGQIEAGRAMIDSKTKSRLIAYLYHFLTAGGGEDSYVVFNHTRDNLSPEHKRYLPQSHTWKNRPPAIALGHELIHAWRVAVGMVLYPYGWEEEAMTVGVPPFGFMDYTENRIRSEWGGLAIRPDYQNIRFKTDMFSNDEKIKAGLDPSNNAWTGNDSSLHSNQGVAQVMAQRRKAMGYDDDDDDDGW